MVQGRPNDECRAAESERKCCWRADGLILYVSGDFPLNFLETEGGDLGDVIVRLKGGPYTHTHTNLGFKSTYSFHNGFSNPKLGVVPCYFTVYIFVTERFKSKLMFQISRGIQIVCRTYAKSNIQIVCQTLSS